MTELPLERSLQPTVYIFPVRNRRTDKVSFMVMDGWGLFAMGPDRPTALVNYQHVRQRFVAIKDYRVRMEERLRLRDLYVYTLLKVVQRLGPACVLEKGKKPAPVSGETRH